MGGVPSREVARRAQRVYLERHREAVNAKKRARYQANRDAELARFAARRGTEREQARNKLRQAVFTGKVVKPTKCEDCGEERSIHGHHTDYTKPFDVRWLCGICHGRVHRIE